MSWPDIDFSTNSLVVGHLDLSKMIKIMYDVIPTQNIVFTTIKSPQKQLSTNKADFSPPFLRRSKNELTTIVVENNSKSMLE